MKLQGKNILIVGASQGIGEALALALASGQNKIAITARRVNVLRTVAEKIKAKGSEALVIPADALDSKLAVTVVQQVQQAFGHIDLAILVVGGAPPALTYTSSAEETQAIMELNFHTMVNYFQPLAQLMRQQGKGHIAHINSLASFVSMPLTGAYAAAKAACRFFLDTARAELLDDHVKITVLCPGFIDTPGLQGIDPSPFPLLKAQDAAQRMIKAIEKEKRQFAFPKKIVSAIQSTKILPYFLMKNIQKRLIEKGKKHLE